MTRADTRTDAIYDDLRASHGSGARASGYLSEYSFLRERELILDVIGNEPGTVLDVAGGAGLVTAPLAQAGRRVVVVDFNAAACREARRNGIGAVRGDAFALPLADAAADVVVNVECAQQYGLPAVERMLREAARVLRPAGRLVLVWSNRAALVHRIASAVLAPVNLLRGRTSLTLIGHAPPEVRAAGERAGLAFDEAFAIFPPIRLRLRRTGGLPAGFIGSSFIAVFRKPAVG